MEKAVDFYLLFKRKARGFVGGELEISRLAASLCRFKEKGRLKCKPMLKRARTFCEPVLQNARKSMLRSCYSFPGKSDGKMVDSSSWSLEKRQALQQAENLKWQQEMYHRILKIMGLCQEGLVDKAELKLFRLKLLDRVTSLHVDGEWADFTRDKLLFLQDLLFARCISEEDYHEAKRPLLLRLAEQGAVIDSNDVLLSCSFQRVTITQPNRPPTMTRGSVEFFTENFEAENVDIAETAPEPKSNQAKKKSAMRLLAKAISNFRSKRKLPQGFKVKEPAEVFDSCKRLNSRNPDQCPDRDAPAPPQATCGSNHAASPKDHYNPFSDDELIPDTHNHGFSEINNSQEGGHVSSRRFYSEGSEFPPYRPASPHSSYDTPERSESPAPAESPPRASPKSASSASSSKRIRLGNLITDFISKLRGDQTNDDKSSFNLEETQGREEESSSRNWQRLGSLRYSKKLHVEDKLDPEEENAYINSPSYSKSHGSQVKNESEQVPDIVNWKRKVLAGHASSNPSIEKIVEENIRRELLRIQAEMSRTNSEVAFTDSQIDAIATHIPVYKSELLRLFPRSWCDCYGDIVLAVVEREYQGHADQMERLWRARKEEQTYVHIETLEQDIDIAIEDDQDEDTHSPDVIYDNILIERMWNKISMARCHSAVDENFMQATILSH